ncbi:HutD/Ves family protein [Mangrovicella endophytica]|uniref:HutD/Ves family protein n=1 Tax=Mangrovicella endophytica TaxID=2066697 RepID=UPI000C9E195E|nr:HutD family protein [Mangrovicella endophytica]
MAIEILHPSDYRRMPWANGQGTTTELLRRETADGQLLLRLSIADVIAPGPFSRLPGIDRQLTLIEGEGFDLLVDGVVVPVRPFESVSFSGDVAVEAIDLRGASRDFNVMTRRGAASSVVAVHLGGTTLQTADISCAYAVAGAFAAGERTLESGGMVMIEGQPGKALKVTGKGVLITIDVTMQAAPLS